MLPAFGLKLRADCPGARSVVARKRPRRGTARRGARASGRRLRDRRSAVRRRGRGRRRRSELLRAPRIPPNAREPPPRPERDRYRHCAGLSFTEVSAPPRTDTRPRIGVQIPPRYGASSQHSFRYSLAGAPSEGLRPLEAASRRLSRFAGLRRWLRRGRSRRGSSPRPRPGAGRAAGRRRRRRGASGGPSRARNPPPSRSRVPCEASGVDPAAHLARLRVAHPDRSSAAGLRRLQEALVERIAYEALEIQLGRSTMVDPHRAGPPGTSADWYRARCTMSSTTRSTTSRHVSARRSGRRTRPGRPRR